MSRTEPLRPSTFDEALDAYLYHCGFEELASPEYQKAWYEANPDGWSTSQDDRDAYFKLLIAFAVKERGAVRS